MDSVNQYHTLKDFPEDERPREKLLQYGADSLSTAELMAIIIRTGSRTHTAVSLSQEILATFGGLAALIHLSPEELQAVKGIGLAKAAQILAAIEFSQRLAAAVERKPILKSPKDVGRILLPRLGYLKKEVFEVALLDTKNRIISIPRISMGSLNQTVVHPREVFQPAIKSSASAIILSHNHPSGDPRPSPDDVKITHRLVDAGKLLGVSVLDHIIIGDGNFISLKEKGFF